MSQIISIYSCVVYYLLYFSPLCVKADPLPMNKLYNLVAANGKGSCDSQVDTLQTSYTEGLAMAQAAIDAIDAVKGGKISNWSTGTNNNKKAKTLLALFQIKAAGAFHSITSEDSANLQKVRGMANILDFEYLA